MNTGKSFETALDLFKVLADKQRMRIMGLLSQHALSVESISQYLGVSSATTSYHLSRLSSAGLVSARAEGYYSNYYLEESAFSTLLNLMASLEQILSSETIDPGAQGRTTPPANPLSGNRVPDETSVPGPTPPTVLPAENRIAAGSGSAVSDVPLETAIQAFTPGIRYSERDVYEILSPVSDDVEALIEKLVDSDLLGRGAGGLFWRIGV